MGRIGELLSPMPPSRRIAAFHTPSAGVLKEGLRDLVELYKNRDLQFRVQLCLHQNATDEPNVDDTKKVREILLPLQVPILRRCGYPPDDDGVAMLQNAIHRRVCEGDAELMGLANEALTTLGLTSMPTMGQQTTAEQLYLNLNSEIAVTRDADLQDILCEVDDDEIDWMVAELRDLKRPHGDISLGMLRVWSHWEAFGLAPEMRVRPDITDDSIDRLYNPSSEELFEYVAQNRPVVISGALDADSFPPLRDFQDFDYLRQRCGEKMVVVKSDVCTDQSGRSFYLQDPSVLMKFSEWLSLVENATAKRGCDFYMGKNHLSSELPELVQDMDESSCSPNAKFGGCFGANNDKVYCYFGCRNNTTPIHWDPSENLLLVISGHKTYWLFPPHDVDCIYPTGQPSFANSAVMPFLPADGMSLSELEQWPLYRHARPLKVELFPGDMLYLPIFWWHCVHGCQERNMQVNWWYEMHPAKAVPTDPTRGARGLWDAMTNIADKLGRPS